MKGFGIFSLTVLLVVAGAAALAEGRGVALPSKTTRIRPVTPTSLAIGSNGDLYIADPGRQEILRRSPKGVFSVVAGTGAAGFSGDGGSATHARIDNPWDLVALRSGALVFEQARPGQGSLIREITPSGVIRTLAGLHPSCARAMPSATSIAANSAPLNGTPLSVSADGLPLLFFPAQPCPQASHLGPFLQLTPSGELTNTELDTSRLTHSTLLVSCGSNASGSGFTAFFCDSGAGHPKRLLVLRETGTTETYPAFSGGALASAGEEVVAARDYAVVRVMSHRLQTVASSEALDRFFPDTVGVAGINGLAVDRSGDVFVVANYYAGHRHGCGNAIGELTATGQLKPLWRSATGRICG
jgi:hypothetical protein